MQRLGKTVECSWWDNEAVNTTPSCEWLCLNKCEMFCILKDILYISSDISQYSLPPYVAFPQLMKKHCLWKSQRGNLVLQTTTLK